MTEPIITPPPATAPNLQDLRARVLRGEEPTREELFSAIAALREDRAVKGAKKQTAAQAAAASLPSDLTELFK